VKRIFNQPICTLDRCAKNDPEYPNNCQIMINVEACRMAEVIYPKHINCALAWCYRYWPVVAFLIFYVSLLILFFFFTPASCEIFTENQPVELTAYTEKIERETNSAEWQRLWIKHGRPSSVVYSPGQTPYFTNKDGVKCKFI
jgi:hypothetical protein